MSRTSASAARRASASGEYACHEGNHDIRHILEIYRNLERQAAEAEAPESGSK
ncbi:MAG: hypothetical protein OXF93_01115 [Acidobacteria bacterium]|nr:hypothetical protein [Acidobacteriota bacterium]